MAETRIGTQRRPWLAAILSLLQPGLGHVYAGDLVRGAIGAAVLFAAGFIAVFVLLTVSPGRWVSVLWLVAAPLYLAVAVDAALRARRAPLPYFRKSYNAWPWYAAVLAASLLLSEALGRVRNRYLQSFRMPSESMEPTLLAGDWFYVDKRTPQRNLSLGALTVYRSPDDGAVVIKRIVGLPGDTLFMRNDTLVRNGRPVQEPYAAVRLSTTDGQLERDFGNWGPRVVSADSIFALGDNRHMSKDSRHVGLIPMANVLGRPLMIYYSYDPDGDSPLPFLSSIRWGRLGTALR